MLTRILISVLPLALISGAYAIDLTEAQRAEIEGRIKPIGDVCLEGERCGGLPPATIKAADMSVKAVAAVDGEATYNMACMACHATGAGGAPMVGDVDAWTPRIAKGPDALHNSGLKGVAGTSMMAKGGRADLSDAAVMAAVDYMIESSR